MTTTTIRSLTMDENSVTLTNVSSQTLSFFRNQYKIAISEQLPEFKTLEIVALRIVFEQTNPTTVKVVGPNFEATMLSQTFKSMHQSIFSGGSFSFKLGPRVGHPCQTCGQTKA